MGWATVAPIIQVRTDWEASPAAGSLFQPCLRRVEWLSAVQCEEGCWSGFLPHPGGAQDVATLPAPTGRESISTGGSREIAPRGSMIDGWDVIYEKRLAKADPSSWGEQVRQRYGAGVRGRIQEKLEKFPDRADLQGEAGRKAQK